VWIPCKSVVNLISKYVALVGRSKEDKFGFAYFTGLIVLKYRDIHFDLCLVAISL